MSKTFRCCRTALLVVAAILVVTGTAFAQPHTTGLPTTKTCPSVAASGSTYECSFLVSNADTSHGVNNLAVTERAPIVGGTPIPVDCLQPACSASPCTGSAVTSLGVAGSATASCGNIITITALQNCSGENQFNSDNIHAQGTDADTGIFNGLPVSGDAPNLTLVPPLVCTDDLFCTDNSCSTETGCVVVDHPCPSDGVACNGVEACDEVLDTCAGTPVVCNDDGLACNGPEACTEPTGLCASGPPVVCTDDGDACNGPEACTEPTGLCASGPAVVCTDDLFCSTVVCDPTDGSCDPGVQDEFCDDQDICTDDSCDEAADACVNTPDPTNDPSCVPGDEICRTPGFWGTHGGTEKSSSVNITQAVLDAFGGTLSVCGTIIDNTDAGNTHSALEAICVSPKGDSRLQLARQLTAAALNCGITNSTGTPGQCSAQAGATPCTGVSIEDVWDACNAACPTGTTATVDGHVISCIGAIDCFNNGGVFDPATNGCDDAIGESCHDRSLETDCFDFQPPGAAGSPRECNEARKNTVLVVPPLP